MNNNDIIMFNIIFETLAETLKKDVHTKLVGTYLVYQS